MAKASKGVPLSWLVRPETIRGLAEFADLAEFGCFPLLPDTEDMATLIELRGGRGDLSKEAQRKLEGFLEQQARKALTRLKVWLGLRRGRPRDFPKREVWTVAAALRKADPKKHSWSKLALKLDARAYSIDPRGAMDRMRHGVGAVLKDRRGKSKSA